MLTMRMMQETKNVVENVSPLFQAQLFLRVLRDFAASAFAGAATAVEPGAAELDGLLLPPPRHRRRRQEFSS